MNTDYCKNISVISDTMISIKDYIFVPNDPSQQPNTKLPLDIPINDLLQNETYSAINYNPFSATPVIGPNADVIVGESKFCKQDLAQCVLDCKNDENCQAVQIQPNGNVSMSPK